MQYKTRHMQAIGQVRLGRDLYQDGTSFAATDIDAEYLTKRGKARDIAQPSGAPPAAAQLPESSGQQEANSTEAAPAPAPAPAPDVPVVTESSAAASMVMTTNTAPSLAEVTASSTVAEPSADAGASSAPDAPAPDAPSEAVDAPPPAADMVTGTTTMQPTASRRGSGRRGSSAKAD